MHNLQNGFGKMSTGIGFLEDLSDVTCWKALGTQGSLECPRARDGPKVKIRNEPRGKWHPFIVSDHRLPESWVYDARFFHCCTPLPP